MSLITELFGPEILLDDINGVKGKIKNLPPTLTEKKDYLLKDFATIKGIKLTGQDFKDIIEAE